MARSSMARSAAHIAETLKGIDFPTQKKNVVEHARKNNAEDEVLDVLQNLPEQEYTNMADVMKGVGQVE